MPHHRYARNIARLNFYEDTILFPDETPQDIIGFCVGLTKPDPKTKEQFLKITSRRVGITQEYTDIRREVGNLLLRLWDHKKQSLDDFWINRPRRQFKERDDARRDYLHSSQQVVIGRRGFVSEESHTTKLKASNFKDHHDGVLIQKVLEAFNPELHQSLFGAPQTKAKSQKVPPPIISVNGIKTHNAPLLDIVRPTLLVFTMDSNFMRFVDECVIPKEPSKRLDPYNRNLRLWFGGRVLGWYSHFDTETHKDGGEFWYDLKVKPANIPSKFQPLNKLNGSVFTLADPGDGMGGGERFP